MKKVLLVVIISAFLVTFTQFAAAQASSGSLDQPLIDAACWKDVAEVQQLLERGANIEARNQDGMTPLMAAAEWGKVENVKLLLTKRANIEAKNNRGDTPLIRAAMNGWAEVVKVLLEKGANIEARNDYGQTALIVARNAGKSDVVQLLEPRSQDPLGEAIAAFRGRSRFADPEGEALRQKLIQTAAGLQRLPAIPEEARQLFLQASALIKQTSTPEELEKPIKLLRDALEIASWWGDAYYNLGRALELSGQYDDAVKQLNYYLQLKPPEADASEARGRIAVIQAEKEVAERKKQESERLLTVKYVSGGATRLRYEEEPTHWKEKGGIGLIYVYFLLPKEDPFSVNAFRMLNNHVVIVTLAANSNQGAYAGDRVAVWDTTGQSCFLGLDQFTYGTATYFDACGVRYEVNISNPPNAIVTVKQQATGATVTVPVAVLYRGRALKGLWPSGGDVYQGGREGVMVLHFDSGTVEAAKDPNVNAMGLTPKSVTPKR